MDTSSRQEMGCTFLATKEIKAVLNDSIDNGRTADSLGLDSFVEVEDSKSTSRYRSRGDKPLTRDAVAPELKLKTLRSSSRKGVKPSDSRRTRSFPYATFR